MKYSALIFCVLCLVSCDNDFEVIEPSEDIPVVYGFLDISQPTQYIRVERAFVDPEKSALEIAQIADSLYYPETATVSLTNDKNANEIFLTRIDGNEEGLVRESGVFAESPNILYKVDSDVLRIDKEAVYTMNLERGDEFNTVTASTNIVDESRFISPNRISLDPKLNFVEDRNTNITWSAGNNAKIFDLYLEMNYVERMPGDSFQSKSFLWKMVSNLEKPADSPTVRYNQDGTEFFVKLAAAIPVVENIERRFSSFSLFLDGSNAELEEYLRIGIANLGITSTQDIPVYDNLSEGRGIFASTNRTYFTDLSMSTMTLDQLVNGEITKQLNFQP